MGNECSTCNTCKKDEFVAEVRRETQQRMNTLSQQPNDNEEAEYEEDQEVQPEFDCSQQIQYQNSNYSANQIQLLKQSQNLDKQEGSPSVQKSFHNGKTYEQAPAQNSFGASSIKKQVENQNKNIESFKQIENPAPYQAIVTNESKRQKENPIKNYMYFDNPEDIKESEHLNGTNKNKREKRPLYQFKSGAQYDGEWLGGARDGYGIQIWPDGAKYEGEWRNNKANGKGKFWHVDGDYFEGEWKDDKANGKGTYIHTNGAKYIGDWVDDLQEGYGLEFWTDGSKYQGFYKDGKKEGIGVYLWNDKSKYEGQWAQNKIEGYGDYSWLDGRKYQGLWQNNMMHGRGVYTWKDGRKYDGEYQFDKKHGYGKYIWNDGRIYEGYWFNGKQHGKGRYMLSNGNQKTGIWEDGHRIKWLEVEEGELKPPYWDNFVMPKLSDFGNFDQFIQ